MISNKDVIIVAAKLLIESDYLEYLFSDRTKDQVEKYQQKMQEAYQAINYEPVAPVEPVVEPVAPVVSVAESVVEAGQW